MIHDGGPHAQPRTIDGCPIGNQDLAPWSVQSRASKLKAVASTSNHLIWSAIGGELELRHRVSSVQHRLARSHPLFSPCSAEEKARDSWLAHAALSQHRLRKLRLETGIEHNLKGSKSPSLSREVRSDRGLGVLLRCSRSLCARLRPSPGLHQSSYRAADRAEWLWPESTSGAAETGAGLVFAARSPR